MVFVHVPVHVVEIRDVKVKLPSFLSFKRIGRQKAKKPPAETPLSSPNELLDGSDALDASNAKVVDAPTLESNDDSSANDGHEDSSDDAPPDVVELKPHEVKKNNENVDVPDQPSSEEEEWGTINADTSVAYEQSHPFCRSRGLADRKRKSLPPRRHCHRQTSC